MAQTFASLEDMCRFYRTGTYWTDAEGRYGIYLRYQFHWFLKQPDGRMVRAPFNSRTDGAIGLTDHKL